MRILIATGIFPPQIGGPALYAKNLAEEWKRLGHNVSVRTFTLERYMPTGVRHLFYALKVLPSVLRSDIVFALDTWSVGIPVTFVAKLLGKKVVLRTGGDFLWESYVERTKKKVLLVDFYQQEKSFFTKKEQIIYKLTGWLLKNVDRVVFSTKWQKDIFTKEEAYAIDHRAISIVENFYGEKKLTVEHELELKEEVWTQKTFIAGTRKLVWKNLDILEQAFALAKKEEPALALDLRNYPPEEFNKKTEQSYAAILVSLGDISPNMILEAICFGRPFILTRENGLRDRLGDCAIYVDPLNVEDIAQKIVWLSRPENYAYQLKKVREFSFAHTWSEIAEEFITIFKYV
jgi:glycosyltransferase involved in cell wall biosynthesis